MEIVRGSRATRDIGLRVNIMARKVLGKLAKIAAVRPTRRLPTKSEFLGGRKTRFICSIIPSATSTELKHDLVSEPKSRPFYYVIGSSSSHKKPDPVSWKLP